MATTRPFIVEYLSVPFVVNAREIEHPVVAVQR
jgi:hypothetical protein